MVEIIRWIILVNEVLSLTDALSLLIIAYCFFLFSIQAAGCFVCPVPMDIKCDPVEGATGEVKGECRITRCGTYYKCEQGTDCIDHQISTQCGEGKLGSFSFLMYCGSNLSSTYNYQMSSKTFWGIEVIFILDHWWIGSTGTISCQKLDLELLQTILIIKIRNSLI